jgi:hypothetical protein
MLHPRRNDAAPRICSGEKNVAILETNGFRAIAGEAQ